MFQSILVFIIFIVFFVTTCSKSQSCVIKKSSNVIVDKMIHKKCYVSFFEKQNYNFFIEIPPKLIFGNKKNSKYQISIKTQYDLNNNDFLFLKYFLCKQNNHNLLFKNNLSIGYGYNVLHGPVYFSHIQFSSNFYYIRYNNNNFFKPLIHSSGKFSYQLMNNIYYNQSLSGLVNFKFMSIKLENAINIFINNNRTALLHFSYNIILNENRFFNSSPNINRYFIIAFIYFL